MTFYLGKVSCDLHKCASRVRVQIEGTHGVPLSVKASLSNYPRSVFKKGVAVEVEQFKNDGRVFRVVNVFEPVRKSVHLQFEIKVLDAETFKKDQCDLVNPEEKVRFYLCSNYFNHPDLQYVLNRTLSVTTEEFRQLKRSDRGATFVCTTDQFARFLIDRNLNGIKNGFMDLSAKLIKPEATPDAYKLLALAVGITRDQAKRVSHALGYSGPQDILERIKAKGTPSGERQWTDVSDR